MFQLLSFLSRNVAPHKTKTKKKGQIKERRKILCLLIKKKVNASNPTAKTKLKVRHKKSLHSL